VGKNSGQREYPIANIQYPMSKERKKNIKSRMNGRKDTPWGGKSFTFGYITPGFTPGAIFCRSDGAKQKTPTRIVPKSL